MSDKGFIRLNRKFFENQLWTEPREYSRAEAWLDLIQSARFEGSKIILKGRVLEVQRGEVVASRRYLEQRWGWGNTKVRNFLELLRENKMITIKQTSGQTIVSLCNYSLYNEQQPTPQPSDNPDATQRQPRRNPNNKKDKELKTEKNIPPKSPKGESGLDFSFVADAFKQPFHDWLAYKAQRREKYKSQQSVQACYNELLKFSNSNPQTATAIVNRTFANNWSGFFPLPANYHDQPAEPVPKYKSGDKLPSGENAVGFIR